MKIKKRLILSNTLTLIIPFIITTIATFIFIFVSSRFLNEDLSSTLIKEIVMVKSELLNISMEFPKEKAEILEENQFQQHLIDKLNGLDGKIIISKNNTVIFSSKDMSKIDIEKSIKQAQSESPNKMVKFNNCNYIIQSSTLQGKDNSNYNILLLAPMVKNTGIFQKFIIVIILFFILSFIAVNIIMSCLFSKEIITPISLLKSSVSHITNGNLDIAIIEDGDDEIKELCHAFEVMRLQLKASIDMKMKYDDNRKMLVSSISHDLKTPITSIKGYVEGILDGVANTPEKIEEYLRTIYSKAENVDVMIDDLLLYSKLDLNQLPFNFEKTDIINYFNYCIYDSALDLNKSNIKINLKNDLVTSKYVLIDRERMKRVITNILDNSRKYMKKSEGEIIINLRETTSSVIIEIRDNGIGINDNDVNKIFNRFYRCDPARQEAKGSGLGLAIAKQIVEGHNGIIWAISHGSDGTSIIISLSIFEGE